MNEKLAMSNSINNECNYQPTTEDRERVARHIDQLKLSGDGVFATWQGEGVNTGQPSVFLRLHHCNLTCGLESGWQCDTWYTWDRRTPEFWQEPTDDDFDSLARSINDSWNSEFSTQPEKHLVVTGGEPLLQQNQLAQLLKLLPGWTIEIETNGTIAPIAELSIHQINCSPKLDNSGNRLSRRYKPEALRVINSLPNSWFKFVVQTEEDLVEVSDIVDEISINSDKVLIMPEGQEAQTMLTRGEQLHSIVEEHGWQLTLRQQLIWFGNERRT